MWYTRASVVFVAIVLALATCVATSGSGFAQIGGQRVSGPEPKGWGSATLTLRDQNGKVIARKSVKYPIPNASMVVRAADAPNNCWEYCRNVCDGYGVCWLSCGWHCSPWPR